MKKLTVVIAILFLSACGTLCRETKEGDQCRQNETHFQMNHADREFGSRSRNN